MQYLRQALVTFGLVATLVAPAQALPRSERLQSVETFALGLGLDTADPVVVNQLAAYDLVVVDGENTTIEQIAALKSRGAVVLAYLSVGTIEPDRWWFRKAKKYRLKFWEDWGEWIAKVSNKSYRKLLVQSVAPWMLNKGFDGLFLDNFAIIEDLPKQRKGMYQLVRELSAVVKSRGGLLFTQNAEDHINAVLPYLDGWNREDVSFTYDFDSEAYAAVPPSDTLSITGALRTFSDAGLFVSSTDYVSDADSASEQIAISNACDSGAVPFVSDILLTRLPVAPPTCE